MKFSLLKLTLAISLIGIIFLLILSNILEPKLQSISEINTKDLNKKIKTKGQITNIKTYENFQILTISDSIKSINIILNKPLNLTRNQNLTITGTLNQYKNKLQIQAEKITLNHPASMT